MGVCPKGVHPKGVQNQRGSGPKGVLPKGDPVQRGSCPKEVRSKGGPKPKGVRAKRGSDQKGVQIKVGQVPFGGLPPTPNHKSYVLDICISKWFGVADLPPKGPLFAQGPGT